MTNQENKFLYVSRVDNKAIGNRDESIFCDFFNLFCQSFTRLDEALIKILFKQHYPNKKHFQVIPGNGIYKQDLLELEVIIYQEYLMMSRFIHQIFS